MQQDTRRGVCHTRTACNPDADGLLSMTTTTETNPKMRQTQICSLCDIYVRGMFRQRWSSQISALTTIDPFDLSDQRISTVRTRTDNDRGVT